MVTKLNFFLIWSTFDQGLSDNTRLGEKSRSCFSLWEYHFFVILSLFFNFIFTIKNYQSMQNSAIFNKIFLPQFTKSITFWLHINANVKRSEFIIYYSIPIIQCTVFLKANLWGKLLFISTSSAYSHCGQCTSLEGPHVLIWCAWHTSLKQEKMKTPQKT